MQHQLYESTESNIRYGIAIDIGTTNICGALIQYNSDSSLHNYIIVKEHSLKNGQCKFGSDIVSRMTYYQESIENLDNLNALLISDLNRLINILIKDHLNKDLIKSLTISGNTVMTHIFKYSNFKPNYGLNYPYSLFIMPNLGGFIGGDITAGILSLNLINSTKKSLLIDIGTNGEVALWNGNKLYFSSAAAGPAFEGLFQSIPGSEVVNIISKLLKKHFIDKTGYIISQEKAKAINPYDNEIINLVSDTKDTNKFYTMNQYITQDHIRAIQLAIAAIQTCISILLKDGNLKKEQIDVIYVAGAFGNNLDIENAQHISLIPNINPKKISLVGNTSLQGSIKALIDSGAVDEIHRIIGISTHIELTNQLNFQREFINSINF
ncbi:MAG: ASKHA domain-containing protein [Anaerovoracaceae bacterium]